jgi:hypothetical protein
MAIKDLAASPSQCPVSHFRFTRHFLAEHKMAAIPYPPYSLYLAPCDFFQFSKIKLNLKGRRFDTNEEIQAESQSA